VHGHAVLLGLALRNLVENALSHTPRGTRVTVQLDPGARWVQVCDDAGGGASPADESADARPGVPVDRALGLGLGHRVVEKIADLHGARFIRAQAPAGFRSCYRLEFAGPA
jgi:two-component system sensor histidine kinase QseC